MDISDTNESLLFYKLSRTFFVFPAASPPSSLGTAEERYTKYLLFSKLIFIIPLALVQHSGVASQCASPCWGHR